MSFLPLLALGVEGENDLPFSYNDYDISILIAHIVTLCEDMPERSILHMVKLVRVTDDRSVYKGKDGNDHVSSNVYVEFVIGDKVRRFQIRNVFAHDKALLDLCIDEFIHLDKDGKPVTKAGK